MENSHNTHLKIITPNGIFFEGDVNIVTVKTTEGFVGLQRGHIPVVASLLIAPLYIESKTSREHRECAVSGGLLYSQKENVTIITDAIEYKDKIDLTRAEKAKKDAEYEIDHTEDKVDLKLMEMSLARAINRIHVKSGN